MSILFCTFVVKIKRTFSPPETRQSATNMMHAEFHIFEEWQREAFRNNLRTILYDYGQNDYHVTNHGATIALDIAYISSYVIGFHLISCIEAMRVKNEISGYLADLEYRN